MAEPTQRVASFLQNVEIGTRGNDGAVSWTAPNMGKYPLAHISTFQSVITSAARTYREHDEAVRASLDNARYMRNDCGIMECLEGRQRCTALLNWHIEVEDDKSQEQKDLADAMTKIIEEIPYFTEYKRCLLEAIWYGKAGIQNRFGWQNIGGCMRVLPTPRHHLDLGWKPINGDKIVFRFDDGTLTDGAFDGQMGIRVSMAQVGKTICNRWKVEATDRGMAYFLSEAEQQLCVVHSHMIEDAAFEDVISAGSLHGVGVRSRIYWEWVQKQESLAFLMEYLERSAGGIELWHYPAGNSQAKEEVKRAATERNGSKNLTIVPIPPGDEGSQYGVQIIEPGMAGIETLKDILTTYFGYRIKRYILGQVGTTEQEGSGSLGGGMAELHLDTLLQIVKYDALKLEETLTRQLLRMLQKWNFPKSKNIRLKFRIDTEDEDMEKKLEAYAKAYEMGCKLKARDVMNMIGASIPGPTDDILSRDAGQMPPGMGGMPPGGDPNGGGPGGPGGDGPNGDMGDTGHGADGDGSMGSISGNNKGPGLIAEHPTAAGLEDRQRYSKASSEWTDEDERKHPRADDGTFAKKTDTASHKIKVKADNFGGKRWYAMADLPDGRQITHSHEDKAKALAMAHADIRAAGHEIHEDTPPEPVDHTFKQTRREFHLAAEAADPNYDVSLANRAYWKTVREHAATGKPVDQEIQRQYRAIFGEDDAESTFKAGNEAPAVEAPAKPSLEESLNAAKQEFPANWKGDEPREREVKNAIARAYKNAGVEVTREAVESEFNKAKSAGDGLTFDEFRKQYRSHFENANKYSPNEVGSQVFIEKMAALADKHPEWAEKVEAEAESATKQPHEMSQSEYVSADPNVRKAREMLELTRKNTPHNTFAAQEVLDKAEETAKVMHRIEVASKSDGPHEGDRNEDGLVFHDGRWHREETETTSPAAGLNLPEEHDHAKLLENSGGTDQEHAKSAVDRDVADESPEMPSNEDAGVDSGKRSRRVPGGDGRVGSGNDGGSSGSGNSSGSGSRGSDGATAPAGTTAGDGRGLGDGGSEGGRGSVSRAVSHVLNQKPTAENPTDISAGNWRYMTRDFATGGVKAKFNRNLEAIKTLRTMQEEGRDQATPAEQEVLSQFTGWGQMPGLFNEYWSQDLKMSYSDFVRERDKWNDERPLLKSVLSDDEWEAAKTATLNSHFTHPSVVDAHWKMAQKLGFDGGRFLEPSAGIGYYLGQIPPELAKKTRISAVELDKTTGGLLKTLYPKAHVQVTGFENFLSPDGFYDLVASNVPFGGYGVHDKRYNKHNANIHDYFFLKSADVAKPGGLIMHVTSAGTMDKDDPKIRQELAKTCDFVAAVRFPEGTHQENAGTQVVTDLVILRKRYPDEGPEDLNVTPEAAKPEKPGFTGTTTDSLGRVYHWVDGKRVPGPDWTSVTTVPDPAGGEPIPINKYFADHPEQVLGVVDRTGHMYQGKSPNVSKTDDYEERLAAAIERLPSGVFKPDSAVVSGDESIRQASSDVKDGGFVVRDGQLFRRDGGSETRQSASQETVGRIAKLLEIRDARQAVIDKELNGESSDQERARLNSVYDAYVAKHGPLSTRENMKLIKGDPDVPNLLALEKYNAKSKTATKADIFSKETVRPHKISTKADSVSEALGISLNELGEVDPQKIADLTGRKIEDVQDELYESGMAFEDPQHGWTSASLYLSGNVRSKLLLARAAAQADPKYLKNVEALEKVQPEDIDYQDIDVKLGSTWVPPKDVAEFACDAAGVHRSLIQVEYSPADGEWHAYWTKSKGAPSTAQIRSLGTDRKDFMSILNAVLNNKSLIVRTEDENGKDVVDQSASDAAIEKGEELKEKFGEWVWQDDDRRQRLSRLYNDNFNNIVPVKYDGSHLTFPGMVSDWKMRDIQKNFVWRIITEGRGLAAHEVGTGKTASMIASAMELRRLGLAKKPAIAVLKANIEQITREAKDLYPGIKILSTADMFDAHNRKRAVAQIATGDYDLVVMTHDHMDLLPMRPETIQKHIKDQIEELETAKMEAWKEDPKKSNRVVKALEKSKKNLERKLKAAIDAEGKDDAVHFEETGIDTLFVDEAHHYKSLPIYTHGEQVKGVPQSDSDKAINMLMRTKWLMERNGNRGVVFATGTPVANTMAELYNMQRYLQPDALKERGIDTFDAWASTFGTRQTKVEPTASGDYAPVTRFSKFINIPELMHIASGVIDVQRADDQKKPDGSPVIIRPHRHDKIVVSPNNEHAERLMADIKTRAMAIKRRGRQSQKGEDNMGVVCSDGKQASIDMRMIYPDAPDSPDSKLNRCVNNVLKLAKERPGTTQLIFSDVGVNPSKKTGFHLYGELIKKLVEGGIPREKIADFSVLEGHHKDAAQDAMRNGDILIGIGSSEKLGTGVNVQKRVAALHHLDVPWQPALIEQRDGRGYRHGNMNDPTKEAKDQNVDIYRYVAENTLDEFMWNVVGNKAHFINQVMNGKTKQRQVSDEDLETLTPEQVMAAASGDQRVIRKVQLEADVREMRSGMDRHLKTQSKLRDQLKHHHEHLIPTLESHAKKISQDVAHAGANTPTEFAMNVGGMVHSKQGDADAAIESSLARISAIPYYMRHKEGFQKIGDYRGFEIHPVEPESYAFDPSHVHVVGPSGVKHLARSSAASIAAVIRGLSKKHDDAVADLNQKRVDAETIQSQIGGEYRRAAEFREKSEELKRLNAELAGKSDPVTPAPVEPEKYSRRAASSVRASIMNAVMNHLTSRKG